MAEKGKSRRVGFAAEKEERDNEGEKKEDFVETVDVGLVKCEHKYQFEWAPSVEPEGISSCSEELEILPRDQAEPSSGWRLVFLAPVAPGKFEYWGEVDSLIKKKVRVQGRAMKQTSGTPSLKKGVICVYSPPESDDESDDGN